MKNINIPIPDDLHRAIKLESFRRGYTMQAYITDALWASLDDQPAHLSASMTLPLSHGIKAPIGVKPYAPKSED